MYNFSCNIFFKYSYLLFNYFYYFCTLDVFVDLGVYGCIVNDSNLFECDLVGI